MQFVNAYYSVLHPNRASHWSIWVLAYSCFAFYRICFHIELESSFSFKHSQAFFVICTVVVGVTRQCLCDSFI